MSEEVSSSVHEDAESTILKRVFTFGGNRFDAHFLLGTGDLLEDLAKVRVSDCIIFAVNGEGTDEELVDEVGSAHLSAFKSQGIPSSSFVVCKYPKNGKMKKRIKKACGSILTDDTKQVDLNSIQLMKRTLSGVLEGSEKRKNIHWRDGRAYFMASPSQIELLEEDEQSHIVLHQMPLMNSPLHLSCKIHIPKMGIFSIHKVCFDEEDGEWIENPWEDVGGEGGHLSWMVGGVGGEGRMGEEQEGQQRGAYGEEEEGDDYKDQEGMYGFSSPMKGYSHEDKEEEDEHAAIHVMGSLTGDDIQDERNMLVKGFDAGSNSKEDEDEEDGLVLNQYFGEELKDVRDEVEWRTHVACGPFDPFPLEDTNEEDLEFPDEVAIEGDISLRHHLKGYRALPSVHHSLKNTVWSSNVVPPEYEHLTAFENWNSLCQAFKREVEKADYRHRNNIIPSTTTPGGMATEEEEDGKEEEELSLAARLEALHYWIPTHSVVSFVLTPFDLHEMEAEGESLSSILSDGLVTGFSLFPHEEKMSLIHTNCVHSYLYDDEDTFPKSLESYDILLGFRRFRICPLFSENSPKSNVFKFMRHFHPSQYAQISFYGYVSAPGTPAMLIEGSSFDPSQVLPKITGNVNSVDPSRSIIERIVVAGDPMRVGRRTAIVQQMFFNPTDVEYFMKAPLSTKEGAVGNILEPIGLHGHFKARFSKQLNSSDVVYMSLYKRIFPKLPDQVSSLDQDEEDL
jgi:pre-rRNA-processing protein TSR1